MDLGTRLVHRSSPKEAATGAIVPGIHMASTFVQEGLGKNKGFEYARTSNPTRAAFENAMADFEGGKVGLAFGSGSAAIACMLQRLGRDDHVVAGSVLYGGTRRLFDQVEARNGVTFTYVDSTESGEFAEALTDRTRLLYAETPTNPLLTLTDLKAVAQIGRKHGVPVAVDNTFMSPYGQRPIELGCDLSIHSATKYIGGHSDLLAGAMVAGDEKLGSELAFFQNAIGAVASPFDSWLALRGLKTLHLRMERHSDNALAVARFLSRHRAVSAVNFPGLPSHPQHALAKRQQDCWGGMLSFELKKGLPAVKRFMRNVRVFRLAESLGSVESLVSHPRSMTHAGLTEKERLSQGIRPGLVRLSVGIEHADDLVADLRQALKAL